MWKALERRRIGTVAILIVTVLALLPLLRWTWWNASSPTTAGSPSRQTAGDDASRSRWLPAGTDPTASDLPWDSLQETTEPVADSADRTRALGIQGALLLCGGGDLPSSILDFFHQRGEADSGRLVLIPSASVTSDSGDYSRWRSFWSRYPWAQVEVVHAKSRDEAEDLRFAESLRRATAVWISGGDQTRLADRYLGTMVEEEIKNLLRRGGIVGGTSAGSAIATRVMISGGRDTAQLRDGLGLLRHAIVDQHFSQRSRMRRLATAIERHPDRLGIGIDEGTGLLIEPRGAKVMGMGTVHLVRYPDRHRTVAEKGAADLEPGDVLAMIDREEYVAGSELPADRISFLME
jgi:cyanophycinase